MEWWLIALIVLLCISWYSIWIFLWVLSVKRRNKILLLVAGFMTLVWIGLFLNLFTIWNWDGANIANSWHRDRMNIELQKLDLEKQKLDLEKQKLDLKNKKG